MAEVYFVATGPLHWLREFEDYMKTQTFNIEGVGPNGQVFSQTMSGLMEPIQLYRFIYPEHPATDAYVIKTLSRGKVGSPGQARLALPLFALRKALGLKEIPDVGDINAGPIMPVPTDHLQIALLGYKNDEEGVIPTTGVFQRKV